MKHLASFLTVAVALVLTSALPLAAGASRQDTPAAVAGKWALTVETTAGTGTPSLALEQDGERLTGTYSSQVFGEQKVTGTIKGSAIAFGFTGDVQGTSVTVTFTGTADAATMKGTVKFGDLGDGSFTGKKS